MDRSSPALALSLLAAAALAGCHQAPADDDGTDMTQVAIALIDPPTTADAGTGFQFRWEVMGPVGKSIPHTAVHYGTQSVPENPTPDAYNQGPPPTSYQSGTLPREFTQSTAFADVGIYYYRAHAAVDSIDYWTNESTLHVASFNTLATPTAVGGDFTFNVTLPVSGASDHVGVHYSASPGWKLGEPDVKGTKHNISVFIAGEPEEFTEKFQPDAAGTYYLRGHVRLTGVNYLGEEVMVTVT